MLSFADSQIYYKIGGVITFLGVVFDAYASHGLPNRYKKLEDPDGQRKLESYKVGSKYQLYHGMAMFLVPFSNYPKLTASLFIAGVTLFSGSVYIQALVGRTKITRLAPIGGTFLMLGWLSYLLN